MEPMHVLESLRAVVNRFLADKRQAGVSYSGGLDSSLVAKLASESAKVVCYTCAADGSMDAKRAVDCGRDEGFEVRIIALTESDLPSIVARTSGILSSTDPVRIAYTIPVAVVLERCSEPCVLAGNGADELFAGYAKYSRLPNARVSEMEADLRRSLDETARLADFSRSLGKRTFFPFLEDEVISVSRAIPIESKISGDSRKTILREAGKLGGLSAADRPKKAAQYSSGSLRLMKSVAKKRNLTLLEWTRSVASERNLDKD